MAEPRSAAVTRLRAGRGLRGRGGPGGAGVPRLRAGRVLRARVWRAAGPLLRRVPRDHWESDEAFRRRRRVTGATAVTGAALLGVSLSTPPGSPRFYWLTLGVAGTWIVGGLASGPLHLG